MFLSSNCCYEHIDSSFDNRNNKFSAEGQNVSPRSPEICIFFRKKIRKDFPRDTWKAIVTTLSTNVWQIAKNYSFIVRKQVEKLKAFLNKWENFGSIPEKAKSFYCFQNTYFSSKCTSGPTEGSFQNLA